MDFIILMKPHPHNIFKLFVLYLDQAQQAEPEVAKQIIIWLLEQVDQLKEKVDQIQDNVIDRYQSSLDKAHQEITLDYEKEKNVWQPMQQKALNLVVEFSDLTKTLKEEL